MARMLFVIANFSEMPQLVPDETLRAQLTAGIPIHGKDLVNPGGVLAPYAFVVFE